VRLLPLPDGTDGPVPLAADGLRGVVVYWRAPRLALVPRSKRRRSVAVRPTWEAQAVRFEALGLDGVPRSPESLADAIRLAYGFAASYHPIPSDADVYYEVRT
jgi:hypothetical protein